MVVDMERWKLGMAEMKIENYQGAFLIPCHRRAQLCTRFDSIVSSISLGQMLRCKFNIQAMQRFLLTKPS